MKSFVRTYSFAMLAVIIGVPVFAQEKTGIDVSFKGRFGYGLVSKDNLTRRTIGMGIDVGYATSLGRFAAEVGFQYKAGDRYFYDVTKAPMVDGTVLAPVSTPPGVRDIQSGDVRRQSFEGVTFRLSYEYDLGNGWAARGGVQLFGAKYTQQVVGSIRYRDPAGSAEFVTDSYGESFQENDAALSPFIGIARKIGQNTGIEFHVIALSYKTADYIHTAGTGAIYPGGASTNNPGFNNTQDRIGTSTSMVPHLEITYVFRF